MTLENGTELKDLIKRYHTDVYFNSVVKHFIGVMKESEFSPLEIMQACNLASKMVHDKVIKE